MFSAKHLEIPGSRSARAARARNDSFVASKYPRIGGVASTVYGRGIAPGIPAV